MQLKALIVEDEIRARSSLRQMLTQYCPQVELVAEVGTIEQARLELSKGEANLVFLDIHLPEESGFKLFDYYPDPQFEVIFTTAYSEYTLMALRLSAVDYLMKPININELQKAVEKAENRVSDKSITSSISDLRTIVGSNFKKLPLPSSNGFVYVKIEDIIYCEADRNYCNFYLEEDKKVLVSKNLKNYEDILERLGFMRVSRSYIVNLSKINSFSRSNGGEVIMSNDSAIAVSQNLKAELLDRLHS